MEKLKMTNNRSKEEKIERIKEIFPYLIKETESGECVDINLLQLELEDCIVNEEKERYQLNWPGKMESIKNANTITTKVLREKKDESINFETTKNIYIEGDNLDALKILQESYLNKVKCIYIDPPYNTGNDFIYKDNFVLSENEELINTCQIDELGNRLIANVNSNGRFHSNWLSMMFPRLKLARNLLRNDGVIFISIDNNELSNLMQICNEIFGENNFITIMPRKTVEHMRVLADYELQSLNDYVLVYCKNKAYIEFNKKVVGEVVYEYEDDLGKYTLKAFQNSGANGTRTARPNLYYPIYYNKDTEELSLENNNNCIEILPRKVGNDDGRWLWSKEKFINDNKFLKYKNGTLYRKSYYNPDEDQTKYQAEKTWLDMFPNRLGATLLTNIGLKGEFSYSKPVELIKFLINLIAEEECIVMDFFAGSSTTAQAVMELNEEKGYNMSYILVQLPEKIDNNSKFSNICEVGIERIKLVSEKYNNIDKGLRVYFIDSSNMKDIFYAPSDLKQSQLNMFESNVKEDRTDMDLLTQVILDLGLTLDLPIIEKKILNNNVFFVAENTLVTCFDNEIDINIIDEICKINPLKIVFKESSFKTDSDKINIFERIKKLSNDTEINII